MGRLLKEGIIYSIFAIFFMMQTSLAEEINEITFSAGAPLDGYQARIIVPILSEAFKRNQIRFHAKYYPSLRSLQLSNSGEVDGELHRVDNFFEVSDGKYPNLLRIDSLLLSVWLSAFSTQNIKLESWEDLRNYRVIYYRGRKNVEKHLHRVLPNEQIYAVNTDEQAFRMLVADRADIVISENVQGNRIIADNPKLSAVVEIAKLQETKIYAYIHKKHEKLLPKIAETIGKMKVDNSFSKIVDDVNKTFR
jgi:polar amino acid transport system substrate-binding protein